jgi:hypothetical protein
MAPDLRLDRQVRRSPPPLFRRDFGSRPFAPDYRRCRGLHPSFQRDQTPRVAAVRSARGVADWPCDVSSDALQAAVGVVHGLAPGWRGLCREPGRDRVDWIVRAAAAGAGNCVAGPATARDPRIARPDIRPWHPVALRCLCEPGRTRNHLHPCDRWAGVHRRVESGCGSFGVRVRH